MIEKFNMIRLKGQELVPYLHDLAKLRISIFKEYPYLYEGDMTYETNYLNIYLSCDDSVLIVIFDKEKIIGASTAIPLKFETADIQKPFIDHGMDVNDIFYFGESMLLPAYRNKGIYRYFFKERESAALSYGAHRTAFCAVERAFDDHRRPKNYLSLEPAWKHFGYIKHPELRTFMEWKELGEASLSKKPLIFWLKTV